MSKTVEWGLTPKQRVWLDKLLKDPSLIGKWNGIIQLDTIREIIRKGIYNRVEREALNKISMTHIRKRNKIKSFQPLTINSRGRVTSSILPTMSFTFHLYKPVFIGGPYIM